MKEPEIYDGDELIIFSKAVNVYENKLVIKDLLGYTFNFIFEKNEPKKGQRDMAISGRDKIATVVFSKKIRNTLGSGNTNKFPLLNFDDGTKLLFTLYGSSVGNDSDAISLVVTFYLKKT